MPNPAIYWNADRIMKLIITLSLTIAIVLLINYLSDVLLPFFAACLIAYMLQPLVELNRRWIHEKGRVISSFLTVIEVSVVIAGVVYLFMPHVISELDAMGKILHDVNTGKRPLPPQLAGQVNFVQTHFNPADLKQMLSEFHLDTLISKGTSLLDESIGVIIQVLA